MITLIYHQFDAPNNGITVEMVDGESVKITIFKSDPPVPGEAQTVFSASHVLTGSDASEMTAVIDANLAE